MKQEVFKTKDGITVINQYISDIQGICFKLSFNAGAYNDPIGKGGLAHFCEHALMSFSTDRFSRDEKVALLTKYQLLNAYTSYEDLVMIIGTTKDKIEEALDNLTEAFTGIKYTQENFNSEFNIISDEIKTRHKSNIQLLTYICNKNMAKNKEIKNLEYSLAGSMETLKKIKLNDLKTYIDSFFNKKNLVVSVAGNLKPQQTKHLVEKYISPRLKDDGKIGFSKKDNLGDKYPIYLYSKPDEKGKALIKIDYVLDEQENTEFLSREQSALNKILNEMLYEICFTYFRQKKELCYSCNGGVYNYVNKTILSIFVACQEENIDEVVKCYPEFIQSLLNEFTEKRFNRTLEKIIGEINFDQPNIDSITRKNLNKYKIFGSLLGSKEYDYFNKIYKSIKYEDVINKIKNLKNKKPNIVIIAENEKYKDFDYKDYNKKILIK